MGKSVTGKQRITKMVEEQVYFRETVNATLEQYKKYVDSSLDKLKREITKLSRGQKQLVDWTGMVFNCYIPKEFCLLNLSLMGLPVTSEVFDKYVEQNRYGKPIKKEIDGETLYNFKNVFKFFLFSNIEKPIRELLSKRIDTPIPLLAQRQAEIMAKAILKVDGENTFHFDYATLQSFEKEVYGRDLANKAQIKPSNEETNEKQ